MTNVKIGGDYISIEESNGQHVYCNVLDIIEDVVFFRYWGRDTSVWSTTDLSIEEFSKKFKSYKNKLKQPRIDEFGPYRFIDLDRHQINQAWNLFNDDPGDARGDG